MRNYFDLAIGSVSGLDHSRIGMLCQDSYAAARTDSYVCGIVSDGCGGIPDGIGEGHPRSEVGAAMLSRLAAKVIPMQLSQCREPDKASVEVALEAARMKMLETLVMYAHSLADERKDAVAEEAGGLYWPASCLELVVGMYFSATLVGFFSSDSIFCVFSIGDGFYSVNGLLKQLDTADADNNAPAYISYGLMGDVKGIPKEALRFKANCVMKPDDVDRAMIATDGIRFLVGQDETQVPGKCSKVGSVAQLWDDKVFVNKDILRRKLSLLNKDVSVPDWAAQTMVVHSAILKDDTTVMSARRRII